MISINFTGTSIDEVRAQALAFVVKMVGSQPQLPADLLYPPEAVETKMSELTTWDKAPDPGQVEKVKRRWRTKAQIEADTLALAKQATPAPAAVEDAPATVEDAVGAYRRAKAQADTLALAKQATQDPPTPAPAAEPANTLALANATVEDAIGALKIVVGTDELGPEAGRKVLTQFGVTRISLLTPDQWAPFVAACAALV